MSEFYTVIENQGDNNGGTGLLYFYYNSLPQAESKFYTVCAAAAISPMPYHAAYLLQSEGLILGSKIYDRRTEQVEEPVAGE